MAKFEGHKRLHQEDRELILSDFYSSFLVIKDEGELMSYLNDLLSEPELEMLARRVQIARMLKENFTYEEIRTALYVSEGTVASCAQSLKRGEGGLDLVAARLSGQSEDNAVEEQPEEAVEEEEEVVQSQKVRATPMIGRLRQGKSEVTKKTAKRSSNLRSMRLGR
ncbi:MAG: YerC/YecD family TrpR-related protein [bacterium]